MTEQEALDLARTVEDHPDGYRVADFEYDDDGEYAVIVQATDGEIQYIHDRQGWDSFLKERRRIKRKEERQEAIRGKWRKIREEG